MWIIVATVLLLYLLGFLFICYLNAENHGNPSNSDNNSVSASNNDERENFYRRHYHNRYHRYHRLFLSRLLSSNYQCEEDTSREQQRPSSRQSGNSTEPGRSGLFAYRQQQLQQIHHEINEMSYLLGASQSQSDQHHTTVPVPILSGRSIVQPLRSSASNSPSNYFNNSTSQYSFIHQLMSSTAAVMNSSTTTNAGASNVGTSNSNIAYHSCGSSSLSYSPNGSENCHIFRERQRRLRHIRMELEGLSLQLSNVDDRSATGNTPQFHGTTTSSSVLMSVSPSSVGTTYDMEHHLGDSASLIYFAGANGGNGNSSWSDDNEDDDLPGYESIVCLLDSRQRAPQMEESPPPSYSEAVHLYSFGGRGERKK